MDNSTIKCPNCGELIDINAMLYHGIEDKLKKENERILSEKLKTLEQKEKEALLRSEQVEKEKELIAKAKAEMESKVAEETKKRVEEERRKFVEDERIRIAKEVNQEKSEQIKLLEEELDKKSKLMSEYNKQSSELAILKREKSELENELKAKFENDLNRLLQEKIAKNNEEIQAKYEMKLKEKEKTIEDLNKLTKQQQDKILQGSMQLQGEVQELAIEEYLKTQFPFDTIEEIKKGANGADCIQNVKNDKNQFCGQIYYESKRTKNFSNDWIEKFKNDMREKNISVGVLVTETMPKDMERMGLKDGVWVCNFEEFKGLSIALRHSLINLNQVIVSQENKEDKIHLMYDYFTGSIFKAHVEAIVDGFVQMKDDLEKEKRAITKQWASREKQLEKVLKNTAAMYGDLQGIAGSSALEIKQLELDE